MTWTTEKFNHVVTLAQELGRELGWLEDGESTPINGTAGKPAKKPTAKAASAAATEEIVKQAATAGAPAAPAGVDRQMLPLCSAHAAAVDATKIRAIPSESSACTMCAAVHAKAEGKTAGLTVGEVKQVAEALINKVNAEACWTLLQSFGAQSLTGAPDEDGNATVPLAAEKYEAFVNKAMELMGGATKPKAPKKQQL